MNRKVLLIGLLLLLFGQTFAQERIALWEGYKVKNGKQVTLTPYVAENNVDSIAVIVCPGGSYCWLDKDNEGKKVAKWLQSNGITAFVLHYRTAGFGAYFWHYRVVFRGKRYPDMVTDAQRALQWVRDHADEYHINPDKVGMMGFSAGGHLVMLSACFNEYNFLKECGIETETDLRPSFVAPIYPVVTMTEDCVHKRSRRALLGDDNQNDKTLQDSLSVERHIPDNCPPVFLINCIDDPVVDYHNSVLLDSALTVKNINHRYFQYYTGGHGFGASEEKGTPECRAWKNEFINWVKGLFSRK